MKRHQFQTAFVLSLTLMDASALILAFQAAYWTRFHSLAFRHLFPITKGIPNLTVYHQSLWALLPIALLLFFYKGFYSQVLLGAYDEIIRIMKGVLLFTLLATAMSFAYRHEAEYSRLTIGLWGIYSVAIICALRELDKFIFEILMTRMAGPRHLLVVGTGKAMDAIHHMSESLPSSRSTFLDSFENSTVFETQIRHHRISEVLLIQGSLNSNTILDASRVCEQLDVECKVVPDLLEMRRGEIILDGFHGLPTFRIKSLSLYGSNYVLKRSFDLLLGTLALLILGIPMTLIVIAIKLDSPGPVFFKHKRMGLRAREFDFYKFRTMVANAHDLIDQLKHLNDRQGPAFKMKNDPRITKFGKFLRRYSLDELPQLFNVLKGDMSLVGPRPQVLWEAAHYDDTAKKRLRIKPGITGLWQVSGRAALSYEEMINLDIYYLENWSLGLDLKILLRTLPAVFASEGAY